jgi:hypothetical protein
MARPTRTYNCITSYLAANKPEYIVNRLTSNVRTDRDTIDNLFSSYPLAKSSLEKKMICIVSFTEQHERDPYGILSKYESELSILSLSFKKAKRTFLYLMCQKKEQVCSSFISCA